MGRIIMANAPILKKRDRSHSADKRDIIIAHLKAENDGLYLAYGEINKRLRLEEDENKKLKKQLKEQGKQKENEES